MTSNDLSHAADAPPVESHHFTHLNLHTEYSIQNSTIRIDEAIAKAKHLGMKALAITDLNNGFAWIKFYQAAIKAGIKPIIGLDLIMEGGSTLTLFAQNHQGYLNLCHLLARFWQLQKGFLAIEELKTAQYNYCENLIAVVYDDAFIHQYQSYFHERIYMGMHYTQSLDQSRIEQQLIWAAEYQIPIVAMQSIYFLEASDFQAHEVRYCITNAYVLNDVKRPRPFNTEHYFKTSVEMSALFAALPDALANTWQIAQRCNLILELGRPQLPDFPTPNQISLDDFLRQEAKKGLTERLIQLGILGHEQHEYQQRLDFELNVIIQMGFAGYFLIVADFINWAKKNGVPVGPGRGSGAGSLVAYVLKITDLDPLRYGLLFERFLNPERVSMPDFDIDFCQQGRDRVIQYVKQKYGSAAVSQIATFGTMAAKAAIRDVGRVMQLGYGFVDGVAKLIPFKPGKPVTIESSLQEEPLLKQRQEQEEDVAELLEFAQKMEGLTRNVGMHAGGVLIAPGKLTDFCPLFSQDGETLISQYDKDDVEAIGLVKFDFLGLTTLSILERAQQLIQQFFDPEFYYEKLPLNDAKTFQLLKQGLTVAVFQLESRGMQGMLKDAKPDCFEDIIALVSLYRPGPMDLIPSYIARKQGLEKIIYPDPRLESVLKETYGIMVYQEQVMQIAQIIGNYSLGGADLLRRAMGKKKADEMAQHREIFRKGAQANGLNQEKADEIFDIMEKFAGYGFNKSHAAAYALLAYYTAWFKAHYLSAFMAANLSLAMDDTDKIASLIHDAKQQGLYILPPNVAHSEVAFTPSQPNTRSHIRYGLAALKGLGEAAAEHIVRERQEQAFKDIFDFFMRMQGYLNKRGFESLIKAGALDDLFESSDSNMPIPGAYNRSTILKNLERLMLWAQQNKSTEQVSLFDVFEDTHQSSAIELEYVAEQPIEALLEEKSVLGFFLSQHLIKAYQPLLLPLKQTLKSLEQLKPQKDIKSICPAVITQLRPQMTARGKMLVINLENEHENIEAMMFQEQYDRFKHLCQVDACLLFKVELRFDNFTQNKRITIHGVMTIEEYYQKTAESLLLKIDEQTTWHALQKLFDVAPIDSSGQGMQIQILYRQSVKKLQVRLNLPNRYLVSVVFLNDLLKFPNLSFEFGFRKLSL